LGGHSQPEASSQQLPGFRYNFLVLLEQIPKREERDSQWLPLLLGLGSVVVLVSGIAFLLRAQPKAATGPPPYVINLKLSNLKMSTAQNFVGASVTYLEGTITNAGNRTVTHAIIQVSFKDSLGQVTQAETIPVYVIEASGPYPNPVDLSLSPLAAGQAKPFRLTFEHISADWDQAYPQLQVSDLSLK
jgi:hypothetical protein